MGCRRPISANGVCELLDVGVEDLLARVLGVGVEVGDGDVGESLAGRHRGGLVDVDDCRVGLDGVGRVGVGEQLVAGGGEPVPVGVAVPLEDGLQVGQRHVRVGRDRRERELRVLGGEYAVDEAGLGPVGDPVEHAGHASHTPLLSGSKPATRSASSHAPQTAITSSSSSARSVIVFPES